jgi:hypothetical protein
MLHEAEAGAAANAGGVQYLVLWEKLKAVVMTLSEACAHAPQTGSCVC